MEHWWVIASEYSKGFGDDESRRGDLAEEFFDDLKMIAGELVEVIEGLWRWLRASYGGDWQGIELFEMQAFQGEITEAAMRDRCWQKICWRKSAV